MNSERIASMPVAHFDRERAGHVEHALAEELVHDEHAPALPRRGMKAPNMRLKLLPPHEAQLRFFSRSSFS